MALRRASPGGGFLTGGTFGLAFFLPHLWWANEAVGQPGGWLALSVLEAAAVGGFGVAWVVVSRSSYLRGRSAAQVAAAAVLWVAVEQLRSRVPFGGFPWGLLAFSQTDAPLLRLASLGGAPLVSAAVVVVGGLLANAVVLVRDGGVRSVATGRVLVAAVAVVVGSGAIPLGVTPEAGTLTVGAVQGNVPAPGADASTQARRVAGNHVSGTRDLLRDVGPGGLDVVLWPESSSDIDPRTDRALGEAVDAVARAAGVPILLGTQRFEPPVRYNDYVVWLPGVGVTDTYTKQHPVPFGEYVPYRSLFRRLSPDIDRVSTDMVAGTRIGLVEVPISRLGRPVPITVAICFEVAYDRLIRESVVAGGELIVIPTNNASFGLTQESTQQLAMSRFRAVEHGRAVVQISTVGVSGMIAPDGSLLERTGLFTAEQMVAALPLRTSLTLAGRLGRWPGALIDSAAVVLLVGAQVDALRRRQAGRVATGGRGPGPSPVV
ncbi:apolipoprotein N-acyltransferase [Actinotalea sp.]|uniref:apolipoprotein N-acyltransferase n=1 Tax=Actinotalea sp. TaxID=1872145 RepID=UPI00356AF42C